MGLPAVLSNYLTPQELDQIDEVPELEGMRRLTRDLHAVDLLRDLTTRPGPQFILVVKSDVHFPFEHAYPIEHAQFRPHLGTGGGLPGKVLLENSYKNAIAWNVEQCFEALLSKVSFENTVLLYTADHGQNLLDNDTMLTPCATSQPSPFEGLVPMLAITQHPDWTDQFRHAATQNLNRTSHFNLFATLLRLFGYDRDQISAGHFEPSLLDAINRDYGFTYGGILPHIAVGRYREMPRHKIPRAILDNRTPDHVPFFEPS